MIETTLNLLRERPWLAGIFGGCFLFLIFRYLKALFKITVFLLLFLSVIIWIISKQGA